VEGTIYSDLLSGTPHDSGYSQSLKRIEPIRMLFKEEVRYVGEALGVPRELLSQQPFPGSGLAIRCLGEVTAEKLFLLREADAIFRSEVVRVYVAIIVVATICTAASLYAFDIYPNIFTSLRQSVFQVVSLITTTGFATADTNLWTPLAVAILVFLSLVGACAGSTTGGLKFDRLLLAAKAVKARVIQQQHPNAIVRIKIDGVIQRTDTVGTVMTFIVFYILLILVGVFVNSLFGVDLTTGFTSAISCVSNVGPAFGEVGSILNYSTLPTTVKFVDTLLMLFGRLEIFGLIQLFLIKWWV
jgi:trk system potassium uptake protein TrkH